ncbi:hypothetical protein AM493_02975 [Flavobacterium akiainvivens]|uniref:Uncharacterized protein n=1 Tax=Flavobacterium akiainvivens TaxID=1202724 RepID=A0A0M8M957_9FLAO|nr:hypothetical protein [Flavobacterium akiainvivens]KOS05115.1 hypothetical protein AM493_02975 [Flavobacterium akiainvivens]SFQ51502.1 hypothetical protein SAMN05444144_106208 [Flavobacterium akiainvivens]
MYNYTTPVEAIISLEKAYVNKDLDGVLNAKDFVAEARLIIAQRSDDDYNDEDTVLEVAQLLKLALIKSIEDNGFPDFTGVNRDYSDVYHVTGNLYTVIEEIFYNDGTFFVNKIFLTVTDGVWKVAMIEE